MPALERCVLCMRETSERMPPAAADSAAAADVAVSLHLHS